MNNITTGISTPIILINAILMYSLNCSLFFTNNNLYPTVIIANVTPILCFVHIANPTNIPD